MDVSAAQINNRVIFEAFEALVYLNDVFFPSNGVLTVCKMRAAKWGGVEYCSYCILGVSESSKS